MARRTLVFFLLILAGVRPLQALPALENKALAEKLGPIICSENTGLEPQKLLELGVFEAQIAGRLYRKVNNKVIDDGVVQMQAKHDAKTLKHLTYAWGRCANGNAWSITAPTPMIEATVNASAFSFNREKASAECRSLSLQFAARNGEVIDLQSKIAASKSKQLQIPTTDLGAGVLSLSCTQFEDPARGTELWYLIPFGDVASALPVPVTTKRGESPRESLITWLNALRIKFKLPMLNDSNDAANTAAISLAESQALAHDRARLNKVAKTLEASHVQLIGEDRVVSSNVAAMAWLLWNSPGHRRLLLNPKADHVGLQVTQVGPKELLAVFVMTKAVK